MSYSSLFPNSEAPPVNDRVAMLEEHVASVEAVGTMEDTLRQMENMQNTVFQLCVPKCRKSESSPVDHSCMKLCTTHYWSVRNIVKEEVKKYPQTPLVGAITIEQE